ncbi:MAG: hypothetical protein ACKOXB_07725 [Flavobacteriales bacterium]
MKTRYIILNILFFLMVSLSLSANDAIFELSGKVSDNSLPLNNVSVTVYQEGIALNRFSTNSEGGFSIFMGFDKSVKILLEKEGYADERIDVSTVLPTDFPKHKMTHHVDLQMFRLTGEVPFILNEPVALVFFQHLEKKFTSTVQYSKTEKGEEKELSVHDKLGNTGIRQEFKYELTLRRRKLTEDSLRDIAAAEKAQATEVASIDAPASSVLVAEEEAISIKAKTDEIIYNPTVTIYENTRVITKTSLLVNNKALEYNKIAYKRGGTYYFKNGISITPEAYKRELTFYFF